MTWRGSTQPLDRLYGCLPYILPMSAVVVFGDALFRQVPFLVYPFIPFIWVFINILNFPVVPQIGISGEFVIFMCLFFFVIRSTRISHFIRFNTMQAILLEIAMFIAQIILRFLGKILEGVPSITFLFEILANTVFIGMIAACVYAVVQSAMGKYAEIPAISEAAYYQVR
jgi:hypothetical protein